ncbi:MAG: cadherin-like domain-containing protein [Pirellulaceae bacterium]|nr:cadherin-like domain-containing protein [Pirellulaceae bacterium]
MEFRRSHRNGRQPNKRVKLRRRLLVERLTNRRVLAAVTGAVFEDINSSFRQDAGEESLAERLLFLDVNENGILDTGESVALSGEDGSFKFSGLGDGDHHIRLYNGSVTQTQVSPVDATPAGKSIELLEPIEFSAAGTEVTVLVDGGVLTGDLSDGTNQSITVAQTVSQMQSLPSGHVLVIGDDGQGNTAWLVDPIDSSSVVFDLSGNAQSIAWAEIAVDSQGHGLAIDQAADFAELRAIDASDADAGILVSNLGISVPADTQVLTSPSGSRSVIGWAGPDGLQLSLWSNPTGSWITYIPVDAANTTEMLAFDDASGLLVLRTSDGGVTIHDVNADFAPLQALPAVSGPVSLDGQRDILVTMSPTEPTLQLFNLQDGQMVAGLDVDLSAVGNVSALDLQSDPAAVVLLGDKGISKVSLSTPAAHVVTIADGNDPAPVQFGVTLNGENAEASYDSIPTFTTDEDVSLVAPPPGALRGATDTEGDQILPLLLTSPQNGSAIVAVDGTITYQPHANFNGVDNLHVVLHDGRSASDPFALPIDVIPVSDPPQVILEVDEIAENVGPGAILGPIAIVDPDVGDEHVIEVNDPRFQVQDDQLIFIGEVGDLNFEVEPFVEISLTVTDSDFNMEVVHATLTVLDANDPIFDITPHEAEVAENDPGAVFATLTVWDEDHDQEHTLTVDDNRFVVLDGHRLALADGQSLNFEAAASVTVNVTATENTGGGPSFTQAIEITVTDVPEQASEIALSDESVIELAPGDVVGNILVDGFVMGSGYTATVDDSRFEIVDSVLKLTDSRWVERAEQDEIELTIDVQDSSGVFAPIAATFVVLVLENPTPYHNDALPFDVNGSDDISPLDALLVINYLNLHGVGPVANVPPTFSYDVNGDGDITPLDILLILNELNRQQQIANGTVGQEDANGELIEPATDSEGTSVDDTPASSDSIGSLENDARTDDDDTYSSDQTVEPGSQKTDLPSQSGYVNKDSTDDQPIESSSDAESQAYADGVDASLESLLDDDFS